MTATSRDQIINELKSRIKLLEKQKGGAEQHMREKLLLSVVSDSVHQTNEPDRLLLNVLERMSIVLDVPMSACCEILGHELKSIEVYNLQTGDRSNPCSFSINQPIASSLKTGPVFLQSDNDGFKELKFDKNISPLPRFIALFPFESLNIPFGAFVFFEYEKKREQFSRMSAIIQHLIHVATDKLEKFKLQQELKELNVAFEEKVEKRIQTLQDKVEKSKLELTRERKKTDKHQADELLNRTTASMQHYFLKNVGVEIRTPLNGIMGFAELIRGNDLPAAELNNYIDIIKSCGKSLLKIVDDAQQYSSIQSGGEKPKKTVFPLAPFMSTLYDQYKRDELYRQRDNLEIKININISGATQIDTDADKLRLILTNLIGNAIKFTGSGEIEFGCSIEEPKRKRVKKNRHDVIFFVKDTGIGIGTEHGEKIFQEFYKVEHEISKLYGGLGLGLAIARALVEMLGGKIWFQSEPNKGTEFYFTLPQCIVLSPAELEALNGNGGDSDFDWSDKKILIVEDDSMSVIYLKEALKSTGAEILLAGNGKAAVELAASGKSIDLILMDIKLPGISGYEATRQIKSFTDIPIIAQTAYAMADDYKKIIQVGCDDYVSKPINRRKLLKKINQLFTHETEIID